MKYEAEILPCIEDLDEDSYDENWDESFLTDDFDEIDRKVEYFSERIVELEAELKRLKKQTDFSASDSASGLSSDIDRIECKIDTFDEQRELLLGHKEILEGKTTPNEVVFAEFTRKLDAVK